MEFVKVGVIKKGVEGAEMWVVKVIVKEALEFYSLSEA